MTLFGDTEAPIIMEAKNITVDLHAKRILDNVSFQVRQGEFIGILGPNGAGKTTLFRVLLNLQRSVFGTVDFPQAALGGANGGTVVGYVPQFRQTDPELPMQVWDFVSLGLPDPFRFWMSRKDKAAVRAALELTGAARFARQPVGRLSGGERQRVYLAQALIRHPQVLLLDEPTSHLDPGVQEEMAAVVHEICRAQGISVLFISHDVNLIARYAERILYLTPGRHALGTVGEIMRTEVLRRLYGDSVELVRAGGKLVLVGAERETGQCCGEEAAEAVPLFQ